MALYIKVFHELSRMYFADMELFVGLICVITLVYPVCTQDQNYPPFVLEQRIRTNLLARYAKDIVPVSQTGVPVHITIKVFLGTIDASKESEGPITANIWVETEWTDERLSWSPDEYEDAELIYLPAGLIWRPDITSVDHLSADNELTLRKSAAVSYKGRVWLEYHHSLQIPCDPNNQYFPYAYQTCELRLASWTYGKKLVLLKTDQKELPVKEGVRAVSATWTVDSTNVTLESNAFKTKFVLKRQNDVLLYTIQAPSICLGFMIPAAFLLPTESNHKLILGGSLLVAQVLAFDMLVENLPSHLDDTPTLVKYMVGNIVLLCLALTFSSIVISLASRARRNGQRVPGIVKRIFLDVLGRLVCVRRDDFWQAASTAPEASGDMQESDGDVFVSDGNHLVGPAEWRQLAAVIDRLLFVIFLFIAIFTMFTLVSFRYY